MSSIFTELTKVALISILIFTLPVDQLIASTFNGSVKNSLDHLLDNNRKYKKSIADWKIARQNVRSASSAAFPSINFDWGITRLGNIQTFTQEDSDSTSNKPPEVFKVAADNTYRGAISIEQQLFSGRVFGAIRVAKSYQQAADAQISVDKNNLIRDYLTAYARAGMLADIKSVNENMVNITRSHFEEAKLLQEIGAADNYTLLRAEVEHLNSIPAYRDAEKSYRSAVSSLKLMLNIDASASLEINSFDVRFELQDSPEQLYARAQEKRPELIGAKKFAEAYYRAITVYRAGRLPSISGFGSYERQNQWDLFGQQNSWNNTWVAGFNIRIPIFNGFATSSQIQIGRLNYLKAREDVSILKHAISNEVELAYDDYVRSSADFDAWFRNVDLATEGFEIAKLRWSNGLGSELELRDARIAFQSAEANLSRAKYDQLRTKITMLFVLGEIENVVIIETQNYGQ